MTQEAICKIQIKGVVIDIQIMLVRPGLSVCCKTNWPWIKILKILIDPFDLPKIGENPNSVWGIWFQLQSARLVLRKKKFLKQIFWTLQAFIIMNKSFFFHLFMIYQISFPAVSK